MELERTGVQVLSRVVGIADGCRRIPLVFDIIMITFVVVVAVVVLVMVKWMVIFGTFPF